MTRMHMDAKEDEPPQRSQPQPQERDDQHILVELKRRQISNAAAVAVTTHDVPYSPAVVAAAEDAKKDAAVAAAKAATDTVSIAAEYAAATAEWAAAVAAENLNVESTAETTSILCAQAEVADVSATERLRLLYHYYEAAEHYACDFDEEG